jgi:methoxymalonate biosynthesis protein
MEEVKTGNEPAVGQQYESMAPMIKCLIWDLDDTLWQGTLREDWNVIFTTEHRQLIGRLDELGILQSIASRNDEGMVMRKLDELGIREFFLYPQCNFGSKSESIGKIMTALNIGMDAAGYIDDNPFERFEIEYFLPDIRTYRADQALHLLEYPEFNPGKITREAGARRRMMLARHERESAERKFTGSREDFLRDCRMELTVRSGRIEDMDRILELTIRTHQMNNMKEPMDEPVILDYLQNPGKGVWVARLKDRFGEHGIIGVCFFETMNPVVLIRIFCISCRIEGRGVGVSFLGEVVNRIQAEYPSFNAIQCPFKPSDRNRPALMLLKMLGFKRTEHKEDYSIHSLPLPQSVEPVKWIEIRVES